MSNDADTKPNPDALWQYLSYFEREGGQNVGAVTGNMLAANRTTLTAEAQQNELNSIIGLIKRSQMSYGGLFAFSGANTMYRKQAVLDVGGWHAEQPTEDIAIAWDMQAAGWRALFAPHIRFFLDVPEQATGAAQAAAALVVGRHLRPGDARGRTCCATRCGTSG